MLMGDVFDSCICEHSHIGTCSADRHKKAVPVKASDNINVGDLVLFRDRRCTVVAAAFDYLWITDEGGEDPFTVYTLSVAKIHPSLFEVNKVYKTYTGLQYRVVYVWPSGAAVGVSVDCETHVRLDPKEVWIEVK